jgi:hypothetical protein
VVDVGANRADVERSVLMARGSYRTVQSMAVIYYLAHALVISIGVAVTLLRGTVWTAIGTSLIATGAAGAVIYVYLARTEAARETFDMFARFGLTHIYDRRAAQIRNEYSSRLEKATTSIDILGCASRDWRLVV